MTVTLTAGDQAVTALASDIVTAALQEIGVTAAGEVPDPQDSAWGLQKLQRMIDQWNAVRELIFAVSFLQFNLTANHSPHTIGPNGDFNLPIRPVDVASASFILNSGTSNPVDSPIQIKTKDWWAALPTKTLLSSIVTHLYYEPTNPLGTLNFWPVCTVANPVRIEIWNSISQAVSLKTQLALPQGYWEAAVMDLAVKLCPSFERPVSPDLKEAWNRAMRIIEENNYQPPRIATDDAMPNSRKGGRPDFNFLTGLRE
jgi:hypothetical protein